MSFFNLKYYIVCTTQANDLLTTGAFEYTPIGNSLHPCPDVTLALYSIRYQLAKELANNISLYIASVIKMINDKKKSVRGI